MHILLTLSVASALISGSSAAGEFKSSSFKRTITKTVGCSYALYLPEGYNSKDSKLWPAILFLHGAGERGSDLSKVTSLGPTAYAQKNKGFQFIVISPQCPLGEAWSSDTLIALLDEIQEKHRVDPRRVYVTGYSMGGTGTWSLIMDHPERFAAAAPLCGRVVPLLAYRVYQMPLWVFHGAKDDVINVSQSKDMVDVLKGMGADKVKLTIYPEGWHDIWTETYNNPELYKWFLEQKLPEPEEPSPSNKP